LSIVKIFRLPGADRSGPPASGAICLLTLSKHDLCRNIFLFKFINLMLKSTIDVKIADKNAVGNKMSEQVCFAQKC
jgi:hypothetical protein